MSSHPYSAIELEAALLAALEDDEFMSVSNVGPLDHAAAALAQLPRRQQDHLLRWVERLVAVQEQIGYEFACCAAAALQQMGHDGMSAWLQRIMDLYDKVGLYPAITLLRQMEQHAERYRDGHSELDLESVRGVLEGFLAGLSGRQLRLQGSDETPYTDSSTLFLPNSVYAFRDQQDNFLLYKGLLAHQWAQVRYGTLRLDFAAIAEPFGDTQHALRTLHALERLRLDACIERDLPGLGRALRLLREQLGEATLAPVWQRFAEQLRQPTADTTLSCQLLIEAYHHAPPTISYQGVLRPLQVAEARARRQRELQPAIRQMLLALASDEVRQRPQQRRPGATQPPRFSAQADPQTLSIRLFLDDRPVAPPLELERALGSVLLDFGDLPPEWLHAAGDGGYQGGDRGGSDADKSPQEAATAGDIDTFYYPEWDYKRQQFRKAWCTLREVPLRGGDAQFVSATRHRYQPLIRQLRRSFEALRQQDQRLRRQPHGDEIDLDALVDGYAEHRRGMELPQNLFSRIARNDRDIAALFMVDMSGSTKGWINDAERESLVLLCEALEHLGDRYAIYGFSGMTRTRCEIYPVKRIDEPYHDEVQQRIAAIAPRDYTRMGVAIRHLSKRLNEVAARTRLLITLSDGKPDDFDAYYRGDYGIEDTRHALLEARRTGIHPFCITIDREGPAYLPHLYGHVNYTVVDEVRRLPHKVADIYRRLTRR